MSEAVRELEVEVEGEAAPPLFDRAELPESVTVVTVDDDPAMADLTATFLEREETGFEVITETDAESVVDHVEAGTPDAVVSDFDMPGMDGLELLAAIRERDDSLPFILFTGKGSEEIASEAISKGVTDYIQKQRDSSQYSVLANRLQNAIQQARATEAVEQSEEWFSTLVENSSDVICLVDENARFKYLSPAAERVLGYEPEELVGDYIFDYAHPDDRQAAMERFFEVVENPDFEPVVEFRFKDPDGEWPWLESRGRNLLDDGTVSGFVVNSRDVTEQKQRVTELRQQNEQLEEMRRTVSHDLRNPLNVAVGSLDLYRETGEETHLDKVASSLRRIDTLIDQIMKLSNHDVDLSETEPVPLDTVVGRAWEVVQTGDATLRVEATKRVEADPERLQQLFENLIRNSVDHGPGDVVVTVDVTDGGIRYEDDGPGIDPEKRDLVFESGYTTEEDKTGFGLAIVNQIALAHGWGIDVVPEIEDGVRFEITDVTFTPLVYD